MGRQDTTTTVSGDGTRFVTKVNGTPFGGSGATMSCYLCGVHWPRSAGTFRKFLGKSQFVCSAHGSAKR